MSVDTGTQPNSSLHQRMTGLHDQLCERIIGQTHFIKRLLIAMLANGHLLVEGAPGLAKTMAIKTLAKHIEADFSRIQFTPDLLPADLTGTDIYRSDKQAFEFQPGPLFHNLLLADEVNRAPAKVQSALLEAMGEGQITVGKTTYPLPELFLVMATQNPIEQEGTYPLPEAQLDRFLMHVRVDYPDKNAEQAILKLARQQANEQLTRKHTHAHDKISQQDIRQARQEVLNVHVSEALEQYIVAIIMASRNPSHYSDTLTNQIEFGASPRGTIALERCAQAHAWLDGRDYATPSDVQALAADVLRHRVLLSFEAEAEGIGTDAVIQELLGHIPLP